MESETSSHLMTWRSMKLSGRSDDSDSAILVMNSIDSFDVSIVLLNIAAFI